MKSRGFVMTSRGFVKTLHGFFFDNVTRGFDVLMFCARLLSSAN